MRLQDTPLAVQYVQWPGRWGRGGGGRARSFTVGGKEVSRALYWGVEWIAWEWPDQCGQRATDGDGWPAWPSPPL